MNEEPTVERDHDDGTTIVICPDLMLFVELFGGEE